MMYVQVSWPEQKVARLGMPLFEDAMMPDEGYGGTYLQVMQPVLTLGLCLPDP